MTSSALVPEDEGPIELRLIKMYEAIHFHDLALAKGGGLSGVRDHNALQSALYAPERHLYYTDRLVTLPELASVMAYELVKQHSFNDGNKRTAALLIPVFMRAHGIRWRPRHAELVRKMLAIAESSADGESRERVVQETALWIELSKAEYVS